MIKYIKKITNVMMMPMIMIINRIEMDNRMIMTMTETNVMMMIMTKKIVMMMTLMMRGVMMMMRMMPKKSVTMM